MDYLSEFTGSQLNLSATNKTLMDVGWVFSLYIPDASTARFISYYPRLDAGVFDAINALVFL
jgi:hypothetical protein